MSLWARDWRPSMLLSKADIKEGARRIAPDHLEAPGPPLLEESSPPRKGRREAVVHMAFFSIRTALEADLASINAIYNDAVLHTTATFDLEPRGEEEARAWFEAHGTAYPVLVAEQNGWVIGWSSLSPFASRPAYRFTVENSVYVHQEYRGRGAGRALLEAVLTAAAALGYRAVVARIADHNQVSLVVHQELGFVLVGTMVAVGWKFNRWVDVDILELLLPESPSTASPSPIPGPRA